MPEEYTSRKDKLMKEDGSFKYLNKGWRINTRNWEKLFEFPSRGMLKLQTTIKDMKIPVEWMKIVFDPEWHGRFDMCIDGSPIMYTAEIKMKDGSNGYIDLRTKEPGANGALYKAREAYCQRNAIPHLIIYEHLRTDEMAYLIERFRGASATLD